MKLIYLLCVLVLTLESCKNTNSSTIPSSRDDKATQQKVVWAEQDSSGDQRIKAVNESNAGFQNDQMGQISIREACFGVRNADMLDVLPTADAANRKDSTLINGLNTGDVYMLQPGEKGQTLLDKGTKIQVRFQVGDLWVWKSNVMPADIQLR